jgi:hypothetical protein
MTISFNKEGRYKISFEDGTDVIVASDNCFFATVGEKYIGYTTIEVKFNSKISKVERL